MTPPVRRLILFIVSAAIFWLWMMGVHELGHVLHARLTGGVVSRVVWHPLTMSRTDVSPNPNPLAVVWGGPVWGSVIPLFVWSVFRILRWPLFRWFQAFAGFCLIANGAYVASGAVMPVGDSADLRMLGVPAWVLLCAGLPAVALGLWLWHRLGEGFGLASSGSNVRSLIAAVGTLVATVAVMLLRSCW